MTMMENFTTLESSSKDRPHREGTAMLGLKGRTCTDRGGGLPFQVEERDNSDRICVIDLSRCSPRSVPDSSALVSCLHARLRSSSCSAVTASLHCLLTTALQALDGGFIPGRAGPRNLS